MSFMNILAPIDCTEDALRSAQALLRFASALPSCKVTLAAAVTPGPTAEIRNHKRQHAKAALARIHKYLNSYGLFTQERIVEANDVADAFLAQSRNEEEQYDVIVLGTYQTQPEDPFDMPCTGSLADRISRHAEIPVLILPARRERMTK